MWQKGKRVVPGSSLRLFGLWPITLAQSLWPCTFPGYGREEEGDGDGERAEEYANPNGNGGMGMGNGLLSSFGAWPGPKRPVKVIGKVSEIVPPPQFGAGQ